MSIHEPFGFGTLANVVVAWREHRSQFKGVWVVRVGTVAD